MMMHFSQLNQQLVALGLPIAQHWPEHYDRVLITGPTASGKSALGLALHQLWPTDIISVDSALVYHDMNIGTAKPNAQELASVPHHLIDLIDPSQSYSVQHFLNDCQTALTHCDMQQRLPVLVGGTMMYVNALYHGLTELPPGNVEIRHSIEAQAALQGWAAMHAQLSQVDPITAQRLAPLDAQRIERALEVYLSTGTPLSSWLAQSKPSPALMSQGRWLHLSIEPAKPLIWQRVEQRFDTMLKAGFLAEVEALKARGDLHANLPSIRCVGYRQAWSYLNQEYDFAVFRDKAVIATRQLAKRQMTWLRAMPARYVITLPN